MAKRTRIGVPSEQDVREQLLVTADVLLEAGQYDRAKRLQQWAETTYALQAPVYRVLARLVNQHARKPDGPAAARIVSIEQEYLPRGGGIDGGTRVEVQATVLDSDTVSLIGTYHMMNDNGMYVGWITFYIRISPSLVNDFNMDIRLNEDDQAAFELESDQAAFELESEGVDAEEAAELVWFPDWDGLLDYLYQTYDEALHRYIPMYEPMYE